MSNFENCKKVLNLLYHTAGVPLTSKLYCTVYYCRTECLSMGSVRTVPGFSSPPATR